MLEQRELNEFGGARHDGRFGDRDGQHRDTITLSALPASALRYMSANYPGDTFVKAFSRCDSSIVAISQNGLAYATSFTSGGTYVSSQVQAHGGRGVGIARSALPSAVQSFLSAAYPNYVLKKPFSADR